MNRVGTLVFSVVVLAASIAPASEPPPPQLVTVSAIRTALGNQIGQARDWLGQSDMKSLAQATGGIEVLVELLRAQSDDAAWQQASAKLAAASRELRVAAAAGDMERSRRGLQHLESLAGEAAALSPTGKRLSVPTVRGGLRPLMMLLDCVYADAKVALISGKTEKAKTGARVLSELARVVSNSRTTDGWSEMSDDFAKASAAAAESTSTDPKAVRQLLRGISETCEACHNAR